MAVRLWGLAPAGGVGLGGVCPLRFAVGAYFVGMSSCLGAVGLQRIESAMLAGFGSLHCAVLLLLAKAVGRWADGCRL